MKKILNIIGLTLALTACGGESSSANSTQSQSQTAEQSSSETVYRIATEQTYEPFIFYDPKGNAMGFEYDLITAIGEKQNFKLKFEAQLWETLFQSLDENKVDIISSGITITEERMKNYDFSEPHFESSTVIVVKSQENNIKSWADIKGKTVTLQQGTLQEKIAKDNGAIPQYTDSAYLSIKPLLADGNDVIAIGDKGSMMFYVKQYQENNLNIIEPTDTIKEPLGFAVKKGNTELLQKINAGLAQVKADGTYDKLYQKWFN